ncbi:hypothetical protein [Antarctobacter jejuensis]|uniref:hypothetical protein n=1 Tax=Antarctobacter jejuensis TaxID=1439938 RepID=UPI003FD47605
MNRRAYLRDIAVSLTEIGFALAALVVWVPMDVDTGVIDVWRRSVRIGDAMLPVFAAAGVLISAAAIGLRTLLCGSGDTPGVIDLRFLLWLAVVMAVSLGLMMTSGPVLAWIVSGGETPYRFLLAQAPWKYLGFLPGVTVLTYGLMALAAHRPTWRLAALAFVATLIIALLYDLPFDTLLLPPNGDF